MRVNRLCVASRDRILEAYNEIVKAHLPFIRAPGLYGERGRGREDCEDVNRRMLKSSATLPMNHSMAEIAGPGAARCTDRNPTGRD